MTNYMCYAVYKPNEMVPWVCTLEDGHAGDHKAFGAGEEGPFASWTNDKDRFVESVTELLGAIKGLGIIGTSPEQVQVLHAAEKVKKILNEVSND